MSEHNWHPDYDEEQGRVIESCFDCGVSRECHPDSQVSQFRGIKARLAAREKRMREVAEEIKRIASSGPAFNDFCHVAKEELNEWAAKLLEGGT